MPRQYQALWWDDVPNEAQQRNIERTIEQLKEFDVHVELIKNVVECLRRFEENPERWDLVILDLADDSSNGPAEPEAGLRLAVRLRRVRGDVPMVFLTQDQSFILRGGPGPFIEEPWLARHKGSFGKINALDMVMFLRRHDSRKDDSRVFVIYGHAAHCEGLREGIEEKITAYGATVDKLDPGKELTSILDAVVKRMSRAGFFVAICSPDDKLDSGKHVPRGNVLVEIGIALGLPNVENRLIVLQRYGANAETRAELPSDLSGLFIERFSSDQARLPDRVLEMLIERGLRPEDD